MLTSAFSSHAFSEEDKPSLPPVVVTAARTPQLQSDALLHTTVITAQQIRDSQAPDLPSLLSREAGLQITQSGGVGSATGMFLRGADTRQTLVIIDGVPMLDLCYEEDVRAETDMNVVCSGDGRFIEVQGTAEGAPFDRALLDSLLDLALAGCADLTAMQIKALAK